MVHFRQQKKLFLNCLIIASCVTAVTQKVPDIYHIFWFSSLMKISDFTNKL